MSLTPLLRTLQVISLLFQAHGIMAANWHVDSLDAQGFPAKYTSLKIDTEANVHVAYVIDDGNRYPLRYAFWDHSLKRWFAMTVDENTGSCSLTLDSNQRPHISYTEANTGHLRYAFWDGANWKRQVVPVNSQQVSYYNAIALVGADRPAISFYEYQGPKDTDIRIRLRTVLWDGQNWQLRTVDGQPGSGKFQAMVADPQGHLHIAYANVSASTSGIRYAYWDGQSWKTEIIEGERENNGHVVGWSCNIALDRGGNPHLTYMDETEKRVKYATRIAGQWHTQVVAAVRGIGYPDRNSIALDSHDVPYIGYFDASTATLHIVHQTEGNKWTDEVLDSNNCGFTSSMQIHGGVIWVSYTDEAGGGLKIASRPLDNPTPSGVAASGAHRVSRH